MLICLQKVAPAQNQRRYYALSVCPTLFGEWSLVREWGRLDQRGGTMKSAVFPTEADAEVALRSVQRRKERRGYVSLGTQMELPFR